MAGQGAQWHSYPGIRQHPAIFPTSPQAQQQLPQQVQQQHQRQQQGLPTAPSQVQQQQRPRVQQPGTRDYGLNLDGQQRLYLPGPPLPERHLPVIRPVSMRPARQQRPSTLAAIAANSGEAAPAAAPPATTTTTGTTGTTGGGGTTATSTAPSAGGTDATKTDTATTTTGAGAAKAKAPPAGQALSAEGTTERGATTVVGGPVFLGKCPAYLLVTLSAAYLAAWCVASFVIFLLNSNVHSEHIVKTDSAFAFLSAIFLIWVGSTPYVGKVFKTMHLDTLGKLVLCSTVFAAAAQFVLFMLHVVVLAKLDETGYDEQPKEGKTVYVFIWIHLFSMILYVPMLVAGGLSYYSWGQSHTHT